ncbi:hypothetical protein GOP47_0008075 [Adiantum capillus-veneris]|uniref:Uncharacterized protein n=1 Tax=Adiantum capillus-veneris TaxID=13818 RepID=A0A9D4UY89_ADICA|nr:hypothetical protein GOP47_0008075 [Adiantum capillus-veneris]
MWRGCDTSPLHGLTSVGLCIRSQRVMWERLIGQGWIIRFETADVGRGFTEMGEVLKSIGGGLDLVGDAVVKEGRMDERDTVSQMVVPI